MVSSQDRRCGGKAQNDDDCCTCPKASDRTVAHGYDRRNPRWRRVADVGGLNILSRSSNSAHSLRPTKRLSSLPTTGSPNFPTGIATFLPLSTKVFMTFS